MVQVTLVHPEIPNNTGCIGRTVVGVEGHLNLVKPLGFDLDDTKVKRAGLDYWSHLNYTVFENLAEYMQESSDSRRIAFSAKADKSLYDVVFQEGDHLVFGAESVGLPDSVRDELDCCRIPFDGPIRSLNLATAVGIAVFEARRQILAGVQ